SQSPNRTIGQSFRLARSRSRAISLPRHQVARDGPGLLDDLRLSLDPTAPHQHDTIADRRVDDVPMGGVHPIAQVGMAGREFRTSGVDEDEVREAVDSDDVGVGTEGRGAPRGRGRGRAYW